MSKCILFSTPKMPAVKGFETTHPFRGGKLVAMPTSDTGAGRWLKKMQHILTPVSGGFQVSRDLLPKTAFTITRRPRRGRDIGLTIFDDFSMLVWRDMDRHLYLNPLPYQMGTTPERCYQVQIGKDTQFDTHGPTLSPIGFNTPINGYIFSCDQIKNTHERRWAYIIHDGLIDTAQAILDQFKRQPKPWVLENDLPVGGAALVPGFTYDFTDGSFEDAVEQWLEHYVLRSQDVLAPGHSRLRLVSSTLTWGNTFENARIDIPDLPSSSDQHIRTTIKSSFSTLHDKGVFGPWHTSFKTAIERHHSSTSSMLDDVNVDTTRMSAHQKMAALTRTY